MATATNDREALRRGGWTVAVHNDYRLHGIPMTFWLFTHSGGLSVKGEGRGDDEALGEAALAAAEAAPLAEALAALADLPPDRRAAAIAAMRAAVGLD